MSNNVVSLHSSIDLDSDRGRELVIDLCRFAEGVLNEKQVKKKYRLADNVWKDLGEDDRLVEKIEAEKLRRIRDGSTKRELAQKHVVKAPAVLESIMDDASASPRHRVDAIKVLDDLAANGPESGPFTDKFTIIINLTGDGGNPETDVLRFDKSRTVDVNPNAADAVPAIAANKQKDDD
jgi:hypothetical protein